MNEALQYYTKFANRSKLSKYIIWHVIYVILLIKNDFSASFRILICSEYQRNILLRTFEKRLRALNVDVKGQYFRIKYCLNAELSHTL